MITPSFGLTATERVLPKLALDFTTASLDPRVTFTRTTGASNPATYVNSSGLIAAATDNQPRFDYNPVTLACKGLLIEESRSNLLTYSEQFDNAAWATANLVTTGWVDQAIAPDGQQTADKLIENTTASVVHYLSRQPTITANTNYTFSIFVKAAGRTKVVLRYAKNGSPYTNSVVTYDLSAVTATQGASGLATTNTPTITSYGNSWYRITTGGVIDATSTDLSLQLRLADASGAVTYTGDGVSGAYVWGAQLEAGAFATSYIPTTSAALTRNADVATMTGTNFSSWFNASEGTFKCIYNERAFSVNHQIIYASSGASAERINMYVNSSNVLDCQIVSGGSDTFGGNTPTVTAGSANIVLSYKTNSCGVSYNASAVTQDSTVTLPTGVSQLNFGCSVAGAQYCNTTISYFAYWPQRLTNSETQAFSK